MIPLWLCGAVCTRVFNLFIFDESLEPICPVQSVQIIDLAVFIKIETHNCIKASVICIGPSYYINNSESSGDIIPSGEFIMTVSTI